MRVAKAAVSVAVFGSRLLGDAPAFATTTPSTPAGGPVRLFATPGNGGSATIVITGAIGDYGNALNVNKNGTADPKGNYVKVTLHKGTFEINSTTLNAKTNSLGSQTPIDKATCSMEASASAPVTLLDGTGLYKGITGTLNVTITEAFILPVYTSGKNKGQCNESQNAQPVADYGSIVGSGTVSFM
jgi:hypothetical protein